ncbi:solute carrier family 25 member 46-like [Dendronephthya gigantea]|uniref:solute carrier family 25 member 46-like n=1 Tax=Dendronephthya gigantea TaxID=151771 RepID=UPI00106DD16B|nr:solute carrier family 25 member 46-like [Dendronephthya gigantea]
MVNVRFRGVELEESAKSEEARRRNPTAEAEREFLNSVGEAYIPEAAGIENWQRLAGFSIGITSLLIEDFLTHPFIVVRRQCMVNSSAVLYHLAPFSVCRVMLKIRRKQGLSTFWKGQGSKLAVRGMNLLAELLISEVTHERLPRDISSPSSTITQLVGHIIGKSISIVLTLPFYSASITETVETEQIKKQRSPFAFIKEGIFRLIGWQSSTQGHGRLLPLWALVAPTMLHGLVHYVIASCLQHIILARTKSRSISWESENPDKVGRWPKRIFPELMASLTGTVLTEILLYPLETVMYRLHLQGTRTMIDDTDNGFAVVSLCTNYDGLLDCFSRIKSEEGLQGFYKGFGALLLQYLVQLLVLRITKAIYTVISQDFRGDSANVDK